MVQEFLNRLEQRANGDPEGLADGLAKLRAENFRLIHSGREALRQSRYASLVTPLHNYGAVLRAARLCALRYARELPGRPRAIFHDQAEGGEPRAGASALNRIPFGAPHQFRAVTLAAKRLMHREDAGVQPLRPDHAEQSAENFTFVRLYEERDPTPLIVPGDRDVATIDDVLDEVGYLSVVAPNRGAVVVQQP